MPDIWLVLLWLVAAGVTVGFGARLGWESAAFCANILGVVIAVPIWLVQVVIFRWRRRRRASR